jgi:hypothetical protein
MTLILILILWTLAMAGTFVAILRSPRQSNPFKFFLCATGVKTHLEKSKHR